MANDTWGYGFGNTSTTKENLIYKPLSTSGSYLLNDSSATSVNSTNKLVFAARFNPKNETERAYHADVTLSFVFTANATATITYMQDMTPEICENTSTDLEYTLTDKRDGSKYTVRKLDDGKCWMTSNLKLKLPASSDKSISFH